MTVVVWVFVILIGITLISHSVTKNKARVQGHNRCAYCKSRLKVTAGKFATTCRKCGRSQPWAT